MEEDGVGRKSVGGERNGEEEQRGEEACCCHDCDLRECVCGEWMGWVMMHRILVVVVVVVVDEQ